MFQVLKGLGGTSPPPEKLKWTTVSRFEGLEARNDDSFKDLTVFGAGSIAPSPAPPAAHGRQGFESLFLEGEIEGNQKLVPMNAVQALPAERCACACAVLVTRAMCHDRHLQSITSIIHPSCSGSCSGRSGSCVGAPVSCSGCYGSCSGCSVRCSFIMGSVLANSQILSVAISLRAWTGAAAAAAVSAERTGLLPEAPWQRRLSKSCSIRRIA